MRLHLLGTLLTATAFLPSPWAAAQGALLDGRHEDLPGAVAATLQFAVGDVDGDGNVDIARVDAFWQPHLYLNDGSGGSIEVQLPSPGSPVSRLALGDVDGDGDLDLLASTTGRGLVPEGPSLLYTNRGAGVFLANPASLPNLVASSTGAAFGDVDGDGDQDIYLSNGSTYNCPPCSLRDSLYLNDGLGGFVDATSNLPPVEVDSKDVALVDSDMDGDLDAWVTDLEAKGRVYLNDGSGRFSQVPSPVGIFYEIPAFGDVDGDGRLDAVTRGTLFLGDGAGGFVPATGGWSPSGHHVTLGDFDGDGDLDAFVGTDHTVLDELRLNDGTGRFSDMASTHLPAGSSGSIEQAAADLDGDGDFDLLVSGYHAPYSSAAVFASILWNDGQSRFEAAPPVLPGWRSSVRPWLADVNEDGLLDLVLGSGFPRLALGALGGFTPRTQAWSTTDLISALVLGDLDGDGDVDLYGSGTDPYTHQNQLFLNDGSGLFVNQTYRLPGDSGTTLAGVPGDVDGDGDLDLLVGNGNTFIQGSLVNGLYINRGPAVFLDGSSRLPANAEDTKDVALADLDGDGDLDALFANYLTQDRVALNDGTGSFVELPVPVSTGRTRSVAVADVDLDGDPDVLWAVDEAPLGLWINDGAAGFTDQSSRIPSVAEARQDALLVDLDGDGDPDVLTVGGGYPGRASRRLFLNDGAGSFVDATHRWAGTETPALGLAAADVDLDGDLDVVVTTGFDRTFLQFNLTRHLAWRAPPRLGKPLTFDLNGPPGGSWYLLTSRTEGFRPIPGVGVLRLDSRAMALRASGRFDADGRAEKTIQVPSHPALAGTTLYWQAVVRPARHFKLTNAESTTFRAW